MGADKPDYILIFGQGRSGTNWLLDLLDLSPQTYCRNEANKLKTSPLAQLPSPIVRQPLGDDFGGQWDKAVASVALRMGDRDRIGTYPKFYINQPVRQLGTIVLGKRRLRQLFSPIMPSLRQPDWPVPRWFVHPDALKQASTVLKLNMAPAWAEWVLLNRPNVLVIHIVRHPGGFLNSMSRRYWADQDITVIKQDNQERLRQIVKYEPEWAERFGEIEAMSEEESELWYWRYASETIHTAGEGRANYVQLVYEDLVANPIDVAKHVYDKCHLPWTKDIEAEIAKSASSSQVIATAWSKKLEPEKIELTKRILAGSFMSNWWED
ncbi:MAG: sulfotransferase [Coleofasciculus sp. B1-GNL1-01]|uniref:sulfotransferase n=1 Tax=Coleofasciculus sp. B1-GNL1-01 TaxID=3068484 RepID=UPI0032FFF1B9